MAKPPHHIALLLVLACVIVSGCSPSQPAMTTLAEESTPTQTPSPAPATLTPSPTPIPYDLTVFITDHEGNPAADSSVTLVEFGILRKATLVADSAGSVSWQDIPYESVTISVEAQGFLAAQQSMALSRGANEMNITLERDPYGLLASEACEAGESLLYLEDFQDGHAEDWAEMDTRIELEDFDEWSFAPDNGGNLVLMNTSGVSRYYKYQPRGGVEFDNAVWRIRVKLSGADASMRLGWRWGRIDNDEQEEFRHWQYEILLGGSAPLTLQRMDIPDHYYGTSSGWLLSHDRWHEIEISTYDGLTQVWLNGEREAYFQDPDPLPPGSIGFDFHFFPGSTATLSFDDLVVCELSAPYISIFAPGQAP
jgi:hypothetical protein